MMHVALTTNRGDSTLGVLTPQLRLQFEDLTFSGPWRDHLQAYALTLRAIGVDVSGKREVAPYQIEDVWGDGEQTARLLFMNHWLTEWERSGGVPFDVIYQALHAAWEFRWEQERFEALRAVRRGCTGCRLTFTNFISGDIGRMVLDFAHALNLNEPQDQAVLVALIEAVSRLKEAALAVSDAERAFLTPDARLLPTRRTSRVPARRRARELRATLSKLFDYDDTKMADLQGDLLWVVGLGQPRDAEAERKREAGSRACRYVA